MIYAAFRARIRWLTLFAIQHPNHLTNSHHIQNYSPIAHHIQYSIIYNSLHYILQHKITLQILYSISLYQYYNIVNICNNIVTIITDMIYSYLNRYNYTDSIIKNPPHICHGIGFVDYRLCWLLESVWHYELCGLLC